MLKTVLTIAGALVLGQATQLTAADAQSNSPSPSNQASPKAPAQAPASMGLGILTPLGTSPAPGTTGTKQLHADPTGICCEDPQGRSAGTPE